MASDQAKIMRDTIFWLPLIVALLFFPTATWAGEPIVIVNQNNSISSINKDELAQIFLGRKTLWEDGKRIEPGLLATNNSTIRIFLKEVCKKTPRRFNAHWMKRIFAGSGVRPATFSSVNSAVQYVLSHPEAIVVVDEFNMLSNVKRLEVID